MSFGLNNFTAAGLMSFNKLSLGVNKFLKALLFDREKANLPIWWPNFLEKKNQVNIRLFFENLYLIY